MKIMILTASLLLSISTLAQAKTVMVTGDQARSIIEAMAAANFPIANMDADQWAGSTLSAEAKDLTCRYSVVNAPDEWMSGVQCYTQTDKADRPNSLALAKAISPFAAFDGAAGSRYMTVNSVKCSLKYSEKAYQCEVDAPEYE